jgi:hypothetical protein
MSVHTLTLVPTAALVVPFGHRMATALEVMVPTEAVKLLIVVSVNTGSAPAAGSPGQNVPAVAQLVMSLRLVWAPADKLKPAFMLLQFATDVKPLVAALVSPVGQSSATALELYVPAVAVAVMATSDDRVSAPRRPGQ